MHEQHTTGKIQKSNHYEGQRGLSSTAKRPPGSTQVQNIVE